MGLTPVELQESIDHWRKLSEEQLMWAEYHEKRGEFSGTHRYRAQLFENTAKSMELSREHGEHYCACHLKPDRLHVPPRK